MISRFSNSYVGAVTPEGLSCRAHYNKYYAEIRGGQWEGCDKPWEPGFYGIKINKLKCGKTGDWWPNDTEKIWRDCTAAAREEALTRKARGEGTLERGREETRSTAQKVKDKSELQKMIDEILGVEQAYRDVSPELGPATAFGIDPKYLLLGGAGLLAMMLWKK